MSTTHTQPEINNFELTPQEEIDCEDMVEPEYDYSDPNHKPPFKYVDYTEVKADDDNEINGGSATKRADKSRASMERRKSSPKLSSRFSH